ncbi:LOW QUALITY PROTEIN: hypothetical protein V2J09_021318 [Rumex salicifolius]
MFQLTFHTSIQIIGIAIASTRRTAHSRFVIPLELLENSTCGITQNSHLALLHELLPVITKGKRQEIVHAGNNNSPLWQNCNVLTLRQSMRVNAKQRNGRIDKSKHQFNQWILQVGEGDAPAIALEDEDEKSWIDIPTKFIIEPGNDPIQQLIDQVYTNFASQQGDTTYLQERAILTPLHDADRINKQMFSNLQGKVKAYRSSDEICLALIDLVSICEKSKACKQIKYQDCLRSSETTLLRLRASRTRTKSTMQGLKITTQIDSRITKKTGTSVKAKDNRIN